MGKLTTEFSRLSCLQFLSDIAAKNNLSYIAYGHGEPWVNNVVPTIDSSPSAVINNVLGHLTYGKLITSSDVSIVVPLINWKNNVIFQQWDPSLNDIFKTNFYCVNSQNNVYKCIFNNGNIPSTSEPLLVLTDGTFETGDGYIWKFMFSINATNLNKFTSSTFMPVLPNTAVANTAIPGTIDAYNTISGGNGYFNYVEGNIVYINNTSSIQLDTNASDIDGFYNNSSIFIQSDFSINHVLKVTNYDGSNKILTVDPPLSIYTNLLLDQNTSSKFNIGDSIIQPLQSLTLTSVSNVNNKGLTSNVTLVATPYAANVSIIETVPIVGGYNTIVSYSNNQITSNNYIISQADINSGIAVNGTVNANTTSNIVTGTNTTFTTDIKTGDYIVITSGVYKTVGVVQTIQSNTSLLLNSNPKPLGVIPPLNTYSNAAVTVCQLAATVTSVSNNQFSGEVILEQSNTLIIDISNISTPLILGEQIYSSGNTFTATVQYVNAAAISTTQYTGNLSANTVLKGSLSNATINVIGTKVYNSLTASANNVDQLLEGAPVVSNSGAHGVLTSYSNKPTVGDPYIVFPSLEISGDGQGAEAYCVVNTVNDYTIEKVLAINPGSNYTTANVTILDGTGTNAEVHPLISPRSGHGSDPIKEFGANYVMVTKNFGNSVNEFNQLPTYGGYGSVNLVFGPLLNNIIVEVSNLEIYNLEYSNAVGTFTNNEIVYQTNSNAYGTIVLAGTSQLTVQNVNGVFTTNNIIKGLSSNTTATINNIINEAFKITPNTVQTCVQNSTGVSATLTQVNGNILHLTNCNGIFETNSKIYDTVNKTTGTVTAVYKNEYQSTDLITDLNQYIRYVLNSNNGTFQLFETVFQNNLPNIYGTVLNTNTDIDVSIINTTGTFSNNETITAGTFSADIIKTKTNYLVLTNTRGNLSINNTITGSTSGATAIISAIYPVVIITDVRGNWVNTGSYIQGQNSGSIGYNYISNTVNLPDLNVDTGSLLYIENIAQQTLNANSQSTVQIVLGF